MESKALGKFSYTIVRAVSMVGIFIDRKKEIEETFRKNPGKAQPDDLIRAAVVLSVAAMDSYYTDIFSEIFIPYLRKNGPTEKMISILNKAGLDTKSALELISMKRPYRRIRSLIQRHHQNYVTQDLKRIDELMAAFGLKNFSSNIEKSLKKRRLVRSIEILVNRRHQIVHGGDINSHMNVRAINAGETLRRMEDLLSFVGKSDERLLGLVK